MNNELTTNIHRQLNAIQKAFRWAKNLPAVEQLEYKKKLINLRRELNKILYAVSEQCSTAAFGESQMGKSYLVSAMLSTPSHPFAVTDGLNHYDFISEINPSAANSTIEATGVITRFTAHEHTGIPEGYLQVQLLSIPDIVLLLCEAYYNQIDYTSDCILSSADINEALDGISLSSTVVTDSTIVSEDQILDIAEYLKSSAIQKKCSNVLNSDIFSYFILNMPHLTNDAIRRIMPLMWNNDEYITRLWNDMLQTYQQLNYSSVVYARFDSVLKRKGTLLDVARLDEMYGLPEAVSSEYEPETEVKLTANSPAITIRKSFFSALIAELCFVLPQQLVESHPFLNDLDILDFPGARRPEQIKQAKLGEGKNLSTVLRRGKVSYLFNKYSAAKRVSTLLFCHNNSMSGESSMGGLLDNWVRCNIGDNASQREQYVQMSSVPPLFIVGTWFNKDLDYQDELPSDRERLNERWQRRFCVVLEKEVLKSIGDPAHWFNKWTDSTPSFSNIYMLRDFKYSKGIYAGYDPRSGASESGDPIVHPAYPNFFADLKQSFVTNDFVRQHFISPEEAWDQAATCQNDGTARIIASLNRIAPHVAKARDEKFVADYKSTVKELTSLLQQYYHPDSSDEKLKMAKRQSGAACMQIDRLLGKDPYAFGRLLNSMTISDAEIRAFVHTRLLGEEQQMPMTVEESQIFMSAGLDSSLSREDNIERLCDYLGVDDEDECRDVLEGIDIERLLSQRRMVVGKAEILVQSVEELWHEKVLMGRCSKSFEDSLPSIGNIISYMWTMYKILRVRDILVERVNIYMNSLDEVSSVGIISDYIAMQLNAFVNTFGYCYYTDEARGKILDKNNEMRLGIDETMLEDETAHGGISMLENLCKQKELLSGSSFGAGDRKFLARFPQYGRVWRWQQQLRMGFVFAQDLPDYDVVANGELRDILDEVKGKLS